jgi:hypothetical protein
MKLLTLLAVSALLVAVSGTSAQAQTVFRDSVLEITMPAGVALPTPSKAADATGADYSSETKGGIYRIQHTEMPPADVEKLFAAILGNIKSNFRVEAQSRFTHQGHPGMRLILSSTALNQVQRMHCFMVNQRLVRVWFIARTLADLETPALTAFFDSLILK